MPYIPGYIIALLAGGFVLQKYLRKQDKERSELPHLRQTIERMGWGSDFEAFRKEHPNFSEYKAFEAFLSPDKIEQVEQAEKMMMNRNLTDQWVFKDGQYLSDFLNELTEQWYISNNAADRRILAIIADAFYGEPIKDSDKLIYPSLPWLMEALIRLARSKTINPKWARLPIIWEVWWWWKKFNYDYEPALWTKVVWWTAKVWSDYGIWKLSNNAADNWEED